MVEVSRGRAGAVYGVILAVAPGGTAPGGYYQAGTRYLMVEGRSNWPTPPEFARMHSRC